MAIDINKRIYEVEEIIQKYNGIPSQTVDRAAYGKVKYFLNKFSGDERVRELIEKWNIDARRNTREPIYEDKLNKIQTIIRDYKGMPKATDNDALYHYVKSFFAKHKEKPEVEKLMYLVADSSCFPLKESIWGENPGSGWDALCGANSQWYLWKGDVAYEYIIYVYKRYGELPGENSKPVMTVKNKLDIFYRYTRLNNCDEQERLMNFLQSLIDMGCKEDWVRSAFYCKLFDSEDIQKKVRELVVENGACAIKYISEMAIPGVSLPEKYVYFYYYTCAHDHDDYWTIRPLGRLYVTNEEYGRHFLLVHFRDYWRCNVQKIKESAQKHYRDWADAPPVTIEDWKYYGQWGLFVQDNGYIPINEMKLINADWSKTILDYSFQISEPYFYVYDRFKYLDYYLFLLENDYELHKSVGVNWIQKWLNIEGRHLEHEEIRKKINSLLDQKGIVIDSLN